ncbi:L-threonate dehydrogenase [Desulfovibrio litoralis]|uniref:L-threonate dehydrogenase n=1 Tax=Desulfovibrio litoralis DSM 11393 TaxID=1121455 RepID=A0A1M7TML9_9BACT|nr:L-threonate dehydrogenase [Desulfovibrio litoralis]SHN71926.1 3-hydroxyisobutyrate dehydrogenase [Desulfovibrio litoralis DSM 11393]
MSKQCYGVVGLGAMGMGMAQSMVKEGLETWGCDLNPKALETFKAAGGKVAKDVHELVSKADVIFLVVVNAEQVEAVLFTSGAFEKIKAGAVVIVCSTVKPEYAESVGERLAKRNILMLDAPISGGAVKASQGQITVMASGPQEAFDKAQKGLDAVAAKVYCLGKEAGKGSGMKVVNQLLAGVHIAAAAEALAFGIRMGLDPEKVYEVITNAAGNSWMFENRVPHILANDYTPLSAVDIFVKDLNIVLDTARKVSFPAPLSAAAHQQFIHASGAGFGREDDSAVIKVFPGIKLPKGK